MLCKNRYRMFISQACMDLYSNIFYDTFPIKYELLRADTSGKQTDAVHYSDRVYILFQLSGLI